MGKTNGIAQNVKSEPGKWMTITRTWKPGDKVELRVPLKLTFAPVDVQHPKRVAVVRGPVVLVRKSLKAWFADFSTWQTDPNSPISFLTSAPTTSQFVPFYQMGKGEPYSMYFDLQD
jgi:DUF1680 family protein